jgi:hypothetical protein
MLPHVARDRARIGVEAAAGGKADDYSNRFAFVKIFDAGRLYGGGETDGKQCAKNSLHEFFS